MSIILNEVVAVRLPTSLKRKVVDYAESEELRVSGVIRQALVAFLKKECPESFNRAPAVGWVANQ